MDTKELIDEQSKQVLGYIERFLHLPFSDNHYKMKLGTTSYLEHECCALMIEFRNQPLKVNLPLDAKAKTLLYEQVFWKIFDKYTQITEYSAEIKEQMDDSKSTYWSIKLKNNSNQNEIEFEFAIQNQQDFIWINDAFQKWSENLETKKKKMGK